MGLREIVIKCSYLILHRPFAMLIRAAEFAEGFFLFLFVEKDEKE